MADPVPNTTALPISQRLETMNPQPTDILPLSRPTMQLGNRSRRVSLDTLFNWIKGKINSDNASVYATAAQGSKADTAVQPTDLSPYAKTTDLAPYATTSALNGHAVRADNPHAVTKAQIGLGNADNTSDLGKPISNATAAAIATHADRKDNPHVVTKSQIGLGDVDNTSDANKPISNAMASALSGKAPVSHTHVIDNITGLQAALNEKANISAIKTTIATGTLTRAAATASGNEVVGLTFMPSYVLFSAVDDADPMVNSDGWDNGTIATSQSSASVSLVGILTLVSMTRKSHTASIFIQTAGNIGHSAKISARSSAGFTIAWTRIGAGRPITVKYLAVQ